MFSQRKPPPCFATFALCPPSPLQNGDLAQAGGLTLDQPAVRSFKTGLSFKDKIELGNGVDLSVQAGAHGSFSLVRRAEGATSLFASSVFGEDVEIPEGACYARALVRRRRRSLAGRSRGLPELRGAARLQPGDRQLPQLPAFSGRDDRCRRCGTRSVGS